MQFEHGREIIRDASMVFLLVFAFSISHFAVSAGDRIRVK